jgi:hypothetical protein
MENTTLYLTFASTALIAIAMLSIVGLKGFTGWLELKKTELESARTPAPASGTGNRIEIADLKERIRKLEAIAAGVDL